MLFKQRHVELILNGTKTQTRRLREKRPAVPGSTHWASTNYSKGGRFAQLLIKRVWQEQVRYIIQRDAQAEGFADSDEFMEHWKEVYGDPREVVWCIEFEVIE